jgi:hypothetical protein
MSRYDCVTANRIAPQQEVSPEVVADTSEIAKRLAKGLEVADQSVEAWKEQEASLNMQDAYCQKHSSA